MLGKNEFIDNNMPLVSVVIPTYNRAKTIERSIRSVLSQTYENLEVIVIDDGSVDNTEEVVNSIRDNRIRYVKLEKNGGAATARNEGVKLTKGEFVAFQDSDDSWHKDKLMKQLTYMLEHPEFGMVYSAYRLFYKDEIIYVPLKKTIGDLEGDIFYTLLVNNTVGTPTMLMHKQCFEEIGGFDETLDVLEDWDMSIRFSRNYRIGFINEVLVDAYHSNDGISTHISAHYYNKCTLIARYKEYLLKSGLFDYVVESLLKEAESLGILEQIKKILFSVLGT